jgi:hypothetical protein
MLRPALRVARALWRGAAERLAGARDRFAAPRMLLLSAATLAKQLVPSIAWKHFCMSYKQNRFKDTDPMIPRLPSVNRRIGGEIP